MLISLGLVRHGRASGHGPDSALLPEGAEYVARLGRRLLRDGWVPQAAFTSPYRRAGETLRILLGELASDLSPRQLAELTPDQEPARALDALLLQAPPAGRVLVVSHNPLVARLVDELTGVPEDFRPGTFVLVELDEATRRGSFVRRIGPDEL